MFKKASDTSQLGQLEKPCNTQPEVTHGMAVIAWKICIDTDTTTHTVHTTGSIFSKQILVACHHNR